jgi:methyl-accepting chemotaxis protein
MLIPLAIAGMREVFISIFNPHLQMGFLSRTGFALGKPDVFVIVLLFSLLAFAVIRRMLAPVYGVYRGQAPGQAARSASLKVPWFLLVLHLGLWLAGNFLIYAFVYRWHAPGGLPFLWSTAIAVAAAFLTGLLTALVINSILLPVKNDLEMISVLEGERDRFVQSKDYLILGGGLLTISVVVAYIGRFYRTGVPESYGYLPMEAAMGLAALVTAGLFIGMLVLSRREYRYQVEQLARRVEGLAEARGDLTQRIGLINFDQVGKVTHNFNRFLHELQSIVADMKTAAEALDETGWKLKQEMDETAGATEQNGRGVKEIRDLIGQQSVGVERAVSAARRISESLEALDGLIQEQSAGVQESASSVEEMSANIDSITGNLERNAEQLDTLSSEAEEGRERIEHVQQQIELVREQTEQLAEANRLISSIAAQTNLLAMNAAIEAAHAGEHGRGFAVVAEEIRSLAADSAQHSKRINGELEKTGEAVRQVVEAVERARKTFTSVREMVVRTREQESEIVAAMNEQRIGSSEVLQTLERITTLTGEVKEQAGTILESGREISDDMDGLGRITTTVEEHIGEIDGATGHIGTSAQRVLTLSEHNAEKIRSLRELVKGFLT